MAAWTGDSCTDASCVIMPGAPLDGGWTDAQIHGHGLFIRELMRK